MCIRCFFLFAPARAHTQAHSYFWNSVWKRHFSLQTLCAADWRSRAGSICVCLIYEHDWKPRAGSAAAFKTLLDVTRRPWRCSKGENKEKEKTLYPCCDEETCHHWRRRSTEELCLMAGDKGSEDTEKTEIQKIKQYQQQESVIHWVCSFTFTSGRQVHGCIHCFEHLSSSPQPSYLPSCASYLIATANCCLKF